MFIQSSSGCMCHVVSVCYRVSEGHNCLHHHIDSLQDVDAEVLGRKEFVGYTGKLEEVWSEVVMSQRE